MNIPNKIRIGSVDYSVEKVNTPLVLDNQEVGGTIAYQECKIEIRTDFDIQYQEITFLHEVVHGIMHDRKIELGEKEEDIVDSIAMSLHQIIRDNSEMFSSEK